MCVNAVTEYQSKTLSGWFSLWEVYDSCSVVLKCGVLCCVIAKVCTHPSMEECHKMLHILVVSGNGNLMDRESSGSLGIPSKTSSFGKQEKTLHMDRKQRQNLDVYLEDVVSTF